MVDAGDAEDILQACRLTLWKQFETFEPGTNFLAWARKIALNQTHRPLLLLEAVAAEIDKQSPPRTEDVCKSCPRSNAAPFYFAKRNR